MKRSREAPLGLYTLGIVALILTGFFVLVILGAMTYRSTVERQDGNNGVRAQLSYLSTCVRNGDSAGSVTVRDGESGPMLVIADGSGYALHIYLHDGAPMEEYSALDAPPDPQSSRVLGQTGTFDVELRENGAMEISTDEGTVLLYLRSGGGQK